MIHSTSSKIAFIESVFGKADYLNSKNISVRCPICNPKKADKKKLAIRVEDDANHCWTCGWRARSLISLVKRFGTNEQFLQYRRDFLPEWKHKSSDFDIPEKEEVLTLPGNFRLLTQHPKTQDYTSAISYLYKRNVTDDDMWRYRLGLSSDDERWTRRIIMPSYDSAGTLNFYVARNIDYHDPRTKYDNPETPKKIDIIFNEIDIDWTSRLTICEGPFDLMKCGDNAVPLLGSDLSENSLLFERIITNSTPVALALDGNMWHTKTKKLVKLFLSYDTDVVVVDTREKGDPGNMSKSQFSAALSLATCPTWNDMFFEKLDSVVSGSSLNIMNNRTTRVNVY